MFSNKLSPIYKGFLEILGPQGLSSVVNQWAVPSLKQWQSGAVQDYALVYQTVVLLGIFYIAYPFLDASNLHSYSIPDWNWGDAWKIVSLAFYLTLCASSFLYFIFLNIINLFSY